MPVAVKADLAKDSPIEQTEIRQMLLNSYQNSVILVMCNRVGTEGNMCFSGESIVIDAKGDVLAKADDTEQILYVDIDMQEALQIRNAKPYTQLRRTEFYL